MKLVICETTLRLHRTSRFMCHFLLIIFDILNVFKTHLEKGTYGPGCKNTPSTVWDFINLKLGSAFCKRNEQSTHTA
jgi:hypothetical protein